MYDPIKRPVVILGAGPGGLAAAMELGKAGIPVTIIDKSTFPREKVCGDALSGKVVEVLKKVDPNLITRFARTPFQIGSWGVTFFAPNGNELKVPFKKNGKTRGTAPGFISRRFDFDNWLLEETIAYRDTRLLLGREAARFERLDDGIRIRDKEGKILVTAGLVIAADGAHSPFAKEMTGMKMEPEHFCAGIRGYYRNVKNLQQDNFIELHFIKDLLPGYFWIFPLPGGMANVGLGIRSDVVKKRKIDLKKELEKLIKEHPALAGRFEDARLRGQVNGFGLPLGSKKRKISGDHFMLVGDAASLIDPFTGEGIGNAMYSGYFAAQQAIECIRKGDFSAAMMAHYDTRTYERLWPELKLSSRMQRLAQYPWLFNFIVKKANSNKALKEMVSSMFEDLELRSKLKNPLFYLKLIFN